MVYSIGGNAYAWRSAHVLVPSIIGSVFFLILAVHQTVFQKKGLFHHDLFKLGHNFLLTMALIFVEGKRTFLRVFAPVDLDRRHLHLFQHLLPFRHGHPLGEAAFPARFTDITPFHRIHYRQSGLGLLADKDQDDKDSPHVSSIPLSPSPTLKSSCLV